MNLLTRIRSWWRARRARATLPPERRVVLGAPTGPLVRPGYHPARGAEHPWEDFLATLPEIAVPPTHQLLSPSVETLDAVLLAVEENLKETLDDVIYLSGDDGYKHLLSPTRYALWAAREDVRVLRSMLDPKPDLKPIPLTGEPLERAKKAPGGWRW